MLAAAPSPVRRKQTARTRAVLTEILADLVPHTTSALDRDWEAAAARLAGAETDAIYNAEFAEASLAREILTAEPLADVLDGSAWKVGRDMPAHLARMCETKLLTPREEKNLFRRMNYAKHAADLLRRRIDATAPDRELILLVEQLLVVAQADRDRLVRANLRLVVSIAKKFSDARHPFDELLSEGISSLLKAVEKFDYDRGFRFSTYATQAVRRTLCRHLQNRQRDRSRFVAVETSVFEATPEDEQEGTMTETRLADLRGALTTMLGKLDPRERAIIKSRFGLDREPRIQTLQALAAKLGVCKERVRQLEMRAIAKLRSMAEHVSLAPAMEA